jgi:hypothetical protein
MKRFLALLSLAALVACNPQESGISINTAGIFSPVLYSIEGREASGRTLDFGEHLLTDDARTLEVQVYNETAFPYTNLTLEITGAGEVAPVITFAPNEGGSIAFPGRGGTCGAQLAPKQTCTIRLVFAPREQRLHEENLTLKFRNYISEETHAAKVVILAGMPATLAFTNDVTQYTFGQLVGAANTPVVERAEARTYEEELEVVNAGGLAAKNLVVLLTQTCTSTLTNACPAGVGGAYRLESQCPKRLLPGEKCKAKVIFQPKNQDLASGAPNPALKEINYHATIKYSFTRDTRGGTAALNGYFRSVSTDIEARFNAPVSVLNFDTPVVSGNRDTRTFRASNLGYREGILKAIDFRDSGGALLARCSAAAGSLLLSCRTLGGATVPLSTLPFTVRDKSDCLTTPDETPKVIEVGDGCTFDLYFQPSVTFVTNKDTEFQNLQPEVVFDSRWRGVETIVNLKLFTLSAKSRAPGRLVLQSVAHNKVTYNGTNSAVTTVNLGHLALQSPLLVLYKPLTVTFRNVGSVAATGVTIRDGHGKPIPIGGAPTFLGTTAPYFYDTVTASSTNCSVIQPNTNCTISIGKFAPIGFGDPALEAANMFDGAEVDGTRYKSFTATFTSGSLYTDENVEGPPDMTSISAEARIRATLVQKGLLRQINEDPRNNIASVARDIPGGQHQLVMGDTYHLYLFLQNIGTGPVPYIRLNNPPTSTAGNVTLLTTPTPASVGADFDCLSLIDRPAPATVPVTVLPEARGATFSALPRDKSCVLRIQIKTHDSARRINAVACNNNLPPASNVALSGITNIDEGTRFFSGTDNNGVNLWPFCSTVHMSASYGNVQFQYYDGDGAAPGATSTTYGTRTTLSNFTIQVNQGPPARMILNNFTPFLTATLYRPAFSYPAVGMPLNLPIRAIPEQWFYGLAQGFFRLVNEPTQTSPLIQGDKSRTFVTTLPAWGERGNFDYIYYLGSFPQGSPAMTLPLTFRNFGGVRARITSLTIEPDAGSGYQNLVVPSASAASPLLVNGSSDIAPLPTFQFNPATAGQHRMVVTMTYLTGAKVGALDYTPTTPISAARPNNINSVTFTQVTQKILVVANVATNHGLLGLTTQDYDVVEVEGSPPNVSLPGSPAATTLTLNMVAPTATLIFDSIKLQSLPAGPNDLFAIKRLVLRNNTATTISDFRIIYRNSATDSVPRPIVTGLTATTTWRNAAGTSSTTNCATLAPNETCTVDLKYQPGPSDVTQNFIMTLLYDGGSKRYLMQNLGLSLVPRSPGILAVNRTTENIALGASATRTSYLLNFGTQVLTTSPRTLEFNQSGAGAFQRLTVTNSQGTKASLLLSYHQYLQANSLRGYSPTVKPPTSVVPLAGEYRTLNSVSYAPIYRAKYPDGSDRILIEASRVCFFGEDENNAAVPDNQKGFNNTSATPCYVIVRFNANFNYLLRTITISTPADMQEMAVEIPYYSVTRSATESFWIHIRGTINPDGATATGAYADVESYDTREIAFSLPKFAPVNAGVGDVVGIRVLMATTATALANPYSMSITTYQDIRPYDPNNAQFAEFTQNLANGQFFFFRAVAIRYDARFNSPDRFLNLSPGEYLSAAGNLAVPVKILVPPLNHSYFHAPRLVIDRDLTDGVRNDTYEMATNRCSTKFRMAIKDPSTVNHQYQLITRAAWDLIFPIPAATAYGNMDRIPHWLADPPVNVDARLGGLPDFIPNQFSQLMDGSNAFYLRNSDPAVLLNQVAGGVLGTTRSNYESYVDGEIGYASSRCMVVLPP